MKTQFDLRNAYCVVGLNLTDHGVRERTLSCQDQEEFNHVRSQKANARR
mgnify:CR=1 FL=1